MKERAEIVARAREPYKGMDQVTEEEIRKKVDEVRTGASGCLHLNARSGDGASCHPLPIVIVCFPRLLYERGNSHNESVPPERAFRCGEESLTDLLVPICPFWSPF